MTSNVEGSGALQAKQDSKLAFFKTLKQIKIKDFGINKLKQEMSIKEFLRHNDKFLFNDPVQRNADVWDTHKRSLLIHSIIMGIPVPNVFVQVVDNKYNVIDGKQRLTTIRAFVENKFPLDKETPTVSVIDEEDKQHDYPIANHLFNALPEEFQDRILAHTLVLEVLDMDDEIKNIVFQRLNNNESLNPIEQLNAYMNLGTIEYLSIMSQHDFIVKTNLSENTRKRFGDRRVILQSLLFLDKNGDTGIGSNDVKKWVIETGVTQKAKSKFAEAVQYLNEVVKFIDEKKLKDALKKTHIPMLCMVALQATEKISPQEFAKWIESFLVERYKKERYRDFASSKAAAKENASTRYKLMLKDFKKIFELPE
jgi:hypothetical protein